MKKFLFLLFMCFGVVFQVQAGVVEMTKENTQDYKNYNAHSLACTKFIWAQNPDSNGNITMYYPPELNLPPIIMPADKKIGQGASGDGFNNMAYCLANNKFSSVIFDGPFTINDPSANYQQMLCANYQNKCTTKITLSDSGNFYRAELTDKTCTSIRVAGTKLKGGDIISQSGFNSPFIYTQNSPSQNLQITINSTFNDYQNQLPAFNLKNGWQVIAENNKFIVEQKPQKHLFYELAMNKITLNRNGQNFASQEDLTNYLQNSDFFIKLGLNETQKANSLNYILPQLPVSNNYYLTILSDSAIQEISDLNINPAPKQLNRIYYAIYPTANPVKINGDLLFPVNQQTKEFTILESGEILVKPEMFVFWE